MFVEASIYFSYIKNRSEMYIQLKIKGNGGFLRFYGISRRVGERKCQQPPFDVEEACGCFGFL